WRSDGMPVARAGRRGHDAMYDVAACRAWRAAREIEVAPALSLEAERAKLTSLQAVALDMKLDIGKRDLLYRSEVMAEGQEIMKSVAAKLRMVPRRLVQEGVVDVANERAFAKMVSEVLTEISRWETLGDLQRSIRKDERRLTA